MPALLVANARYVYWVEAVSPPALTVKAPVVLLAPALSWVTPAPPTCGFAQVQ